MSQTTVIEPVRKSVTVAVSVERAFEVFTMGLGHWWPRDMGVNRKPVAKMTLEPRVGGSWTEIAQDGTKAVIATIKLWEPPDHLTLLWHVDVQFRANPSLRSEVDVVFTALSGASTRVDLVHDQFETLGVDAGTVLRNAVEGGWPGLLQRFATAAEASP